MKNKIILILAVCLILFCCNNESTGDSGDHPDGRSTLIIRNSPGIGQVFVSINKPEPTTWLECQGLLDNMVTIGHAIDKSTYNLYPFSETGSYLVVFSYAGDFYFRGNVSFRNGSAIVDFNTMTSRSSLPLGY
jgi:hypothetical protein